MFVDFNYEPILEDFYSDGSLKIEAILKILENAGNRHSDLAGDQILEKSFNGTAWILTDWYVDIEKNPKYGEKILAKTWSQGPTGAFTTSREFELYSSGTKVARGTTNWVLFDLEKGRPAKVTEDIVKKYGPEKVSVFDNPKLPKIEIPESFEKEITLRPRRNDIDFNHHVHNLVYVDYAMEVLPEEIFQNHDFKKIRITYKNAVKEGEELTVKYAKTGSDAEVSHTVCIYDKEGNLKTLVELS